MAINLGVDTGGTYTDAVLLRDEAEVLASAKALTTRDDLARGIGEAVRAVLEAAEVAPGEIALASLSTTLATNALVEGQGGRVGLVYIGFDARDLDAHGLRAALEGDPVLVCPGGHSHSGQEVAALSADEIRDWAGAQDVSAFAVAAQFATRNPAHEIAAREILQQVTGRPVSTSHELSARLGGPKRALTAVLNARLVGLTHRLILRAEDVLRDMGIGAPMMVVRGDGALMSAAQAQERPIETILSGPAASIVGARWLTGADDALVSDIGGTTTDIALLRDGRPAIDPGGARVGPYRTMVEAVAMRTHGLGGDSDVQVVAQGLKGGLALGPRRVIPVSLMARDAPEAVHDALDQQLRSTVPGDNDARFLRAVPGEMAAGLGAREAALLQRIGDEVVAQGAVLGSRLEAQALARLVARGLVQVSGVTPTDAVHVLGHLDAFDADAAEKALRLVARKRVGSGERVAPDASALAQRIVDQVTRASSEALLEAVFAEEGWAGDPAELARHALLNAGLEGRVGLLSFDTRLAVPVVALGASAACYYPAVAGRLRADLETPVHAGVANAIGAVVGRITQRQSAAVTSPSEGVFRAHLATGPEDFGSAEAALERVETAVTDDARRAAQDAGAGEIAVDLRRDIRTAQIEGREVFLEAEVTAEASGRPRIAV